MTDKKPHSLVVSDGRVSDSARVTRIEQFQSVAAGQFWIAKKDVKDARNRTIFKGRMHMITEVRIVNEKIHAIVLRYHPLDNNHISYKFLIRNFMNNFEYVPDPEKVRQQEIESIQGKIKDQQSEIERISLDPNYAIQLLTSDADRDADSLLNDFDQEAGVRDVSDVTSLSITETSKQIALIKKQARNQAILLEARSNLIHEKHEELTETIKQLEPFYRERADVLSVMANEAMEKVQEIQDGLKTLELYTGENVEVVRIKKGKVADSAIPITLRQLLTFMDEESLLQTANGGADFNDFPEFCKQLRRDQSLLERILPEERCIVAMRFRRYRKDYHTDPLVAALLNKKNEEVFLLIRNGLTIHAVFSPMDYLPRLFPSQDHMERPFRGIDGETITIEDVDLSEAIDDYERLALMYKRTLILLWGLYDRTDVLGRFSLEEKHGHLNLLSGEVQKHCFQFVYDDEPGTMLAEKRPSYRDWIHEKNALLQSGSLVVVDWKRLITEQSAPGCFIGIHSYRYNAEQKYYPTTDSHIAIVEERQGELYVRTPVSSEIWDQKRHRYRDREFKASIALQYALRDTNTLLCLDDVQETDIEYYVNTRHERESYLEFIPLLLEAKQAITQKRAEQHELRDAIYAALKAGNIDDNNNKGISLIVDKAIRQYCVSVRWKALPQSGSKNFNKVLNSLLDQIWLMVGQGNDRIAYCEALAKQEKRKPLRLTVTGRNQLILYMTPTREEMAIPFGNFPWVQRVTLKEQKTKISPDYRTWRLLPENNPAESVLFSWAAQDKVWSAKTPEGHSLEYSKYNKLFTHIEARASELAYRLSDKIGETDLQKLLERINIKTRNLSKKYVRIPYWCYPIAIVKCTAKTYRQNQGHYYALVWVENAIYMLWHLAIRFPSFQADIKESRKRIYADPSSAISQLDEIDAIGSLALVKLDQVSTIKKLGKERIYAELHPHQVMEENIKEFIKSTKLTWSPDKEGLFHIIQRSYPAMSEKTYKLFEEWVKAT